MNSIISLQIYTWVNNVESIHSDDDETPVEPVEVGLIRNHYPEPPIGELDCAVHGSNENADGAQAHPKNHAMHIFTHRELVFLEFHSLVAEGYIVYPTQEKLGRQTDVNQYSKKLSRNPS